MHERELPWPPERPPERTATVDAWHALKQEVMGYLKREVQKGDTRAFMKKLDATSLDVWMVTVAQHVERVIDTVREVGDLRPIFGDGSYLDELEEMEEVDDATDPHEQETANGKQKEGDGEKNEGMDADKDEKEEDGVADEDQGDLAVVNEGSPFDAETRFCLWMLFRHKTFEEHGKMGVTEVTEREINIPPDTALYLVSRLRYDTRKVIADALVFRFIKNNAEDEADDELTDGNVFPAWRDKDNDPSMDAIMLCTDLQRLYAEMVGEEDDPPS